MMDHLVVCVATLVCLLTLGASRATADTFGSGLDVGEGAISGFIKDYAFVDVDLVDPSMALVTFTSAFVGGIPYLVGGVDAVDVNVNASSWSIGTISARPWSGASFTPGPFTDGGSGHVDGFGIFNERVDSFGGFTHSSPSVSFMLTNTSGTWSSAANVLVANADGFDAAAHIFVPCCRTNPTGAIASGFAAEDPPPITTPEPSSLVLLLTGLIGFAGVRRRKAPLA
jgi:hypothetical protein